MIADSDFVLAGEFPNKLELSAKSSTYRALKTELVSRGWKWGSKKVKRQVVKVISR
jgi:hypothetical protein